MIARSDSTGSSNVFPADRVVKRQWPLDAYADFLYRGMAGQLLNPLETN